MPFVRPDIKIPENPMGLLRKTGGPHRTQPDGAQPPAQQPVQVVQPPQPVYKSVQPPVPSPVQTPVQTPVQSMPQPVYQVRPPVAVSPEQKHENRQQVRIYCKLLITDFHGIYFHNLLVYVYWIFTITDILLISDFQCMYFHHFLVYIEVLHI